MKESFLIYKSLYEPIKNLTDEELGELFRAIFLYQLYPENPLGSLKPNVKMALEFFKNQFRLDEIKYEKIVERNRLNGQNGGRPKNKGDKPEEPTGISGNPENPSEPKKADNENDNEKGNDNEKENEFKMCFSEFWNLYPEKKGKKKCQDKYKKLYKEHTQIIKGLQAYVEHHKFLEGKKKKDPRIFIPYYANPITWLNQERWTDEYTGEFKKTADKILRNEFYNKLEVDGKVRQQVETLFYKVKMDYMDKKFGTMNWSYVQAIDPENSKGIMEEFRKLHPAEHNILINLK